MKTKLLKSVFALALTATVTAGAIAQDAQPAADGAAAGDAPAPTAQGALSIPSDITLFGKNDPNNRRATAVVNGEIITGTDVEQRLALIVAASENKLSAEEIQRVRMASSTFG